MPISCFCPGCKSGYTSDTNRRKKNGEKIPSFFSAPKDTTLLEKWRQAIPRADKHLTSLDAVCSLHFKEEDLDSYYEQKLSDGTTWKLLKGKPSLKKDAVPSILPNLPNYLSSYTKKRKLPAVRVNPKKKCETVLESLTNEPTPVTGNLIESLPETDLVPQSTLSNPLFTFAFLKEHLQEHPL